MKSMVMFVSVSCSNEMFKNITSTHTCWIKVTQKVKWPADWLLQEIKDSVHEAMES